MSTISDTSERLAVDVPRLRQRAIGVVVPAVLLLSLLLAVAPLRRMLGAIGHMGADWICLAVALEIASCCSLVVVFRVFFDRVPRGAGRELSWTVMERARCSQAAASARLPWAAGCYTRRGCRGATSYGGPVPCSC